MIDLEFIPYDHVIYSDGVAYHKIGGSIIEAVSYTHLTLPTTPYV